MARQTGRRRLDPMQGSHSRPRELAGRLRRWIRLLLCSAGALLGLVFVLALAAFVAVQSQAVRAGVTRWVSVRLEERAGLRLQAEDWSLDLLDGTLEVQGVEIRSTHGRAVLRVDSLRATLEGRSLLHQRFALASLVVVDPVLDLGGRFPSIKDEGPEDDPGLSHYVPVNIRSLELSGGKVLNPPLSPQLRGVVDSCLVQDIVFRGSVNADGASTGEASATIVAGGDKLEEVRLELGAVLRETIDQPIEIISATLRGRGLEVSASRGEDPADLVFELDADPTLLVPQLVVAEDSYAHGRGRLNLRSLHGEVSLDVKAFPAEVLQPLLGPGVFARFDGRLTHVDATADLALDANATPALQGEATVAWKRGEEKLLTASFDVRGGQVGGSGRIDPGSLAGEAQIRAQALPLEVLQGWLGAESLTRMKVLATEVDLAVDLTVDPRRAESMEGVGSLVWRRGDERLLAAQVETTRGRFKESGGVDFESLAGQIQLLAWGLPAELVEPWVGTEAFAHARASNTTVDLDADVALDLSALEAARGTLNLVWGRDGIALAEVSARTPSQPLDRSPGHTALGTTLGFEAALLPESPGRRHLTGRLQVPGWDQLARARFPVARLEVELPEVQDALVELRTQWPGLVPPQGWGWSAAGSLQASGVLEGSWSDPALDAKATWQLGPSSALRLSASGRLGSLDGALELEVENLDLSLLDPDSVGHLTAKALVHGTPSSYEAHVGLEATELSLGNENLTLDRLRVSAETDGHSVRIFSLSGGVDEARFEGGGFFELGRPLKRGSLRLGLDHIQEGIERVAVTVLLERGIVSVQTNEFQSVAGTCSIDATLPLRALASLPGLRKLPADWTGVDSSQEPAPIVLTLELPELDSETLVSVLGWDEIDQHFYARGIRLDVQLDASTPAASLGTLDIAAAEVELGERRFEMHRPGRLRLHHGELVFDKLTLHSEAGALELSGSLELAKSWRWVDPGEDLITSVTLTGGGTLPASLLNPYLGGGVASGPVEARFRVVGPPAAMDGEMHFDAPEATILYVKPYVSRFHHPVLHVVLSRGELELRSGRAELNDGKVELEGAMTRADGIVLEASFDKVRYRLDYGLSADLSGDLVARLPVASSGKRPGIEGSLVVERGLVRRDVDLEREILGNLFAPTDLSDTAASTAERIDLDVLLATRDGVRVKNNVADLRASWRPLVVRGTLAEPRIVGRIEAEPGGLLFAYGQTFRLDQGAITLTGRRGSEPVIDLVTTSTLSDPTVGREGEIGPFDRLSRQTVPSAGRAPQTPGDEELQAGLTGYLGSRIASTLGDAIGITGLHVRPAAVVFGEADPDARLTVSQDLTLNLALAVAVDIRNAERRTYLLDMHDFRPVPGLVAQIFTTEEASSGVTLQHSITFGSGDKGEDHRRPRLAKIEVDPPGFAGRDLRAALGLTPGDRLATGFLFDAEVEVTELLQRLGYSAARVVVTSTPASRGEDFVDLLVRIEPGPQARFEFQGEIPDAPNRESITSLYRSDFYEPASLEEMRQRTIRALRSAGYLEPEVEIHVTHGAEEYPPAPHQVRIHSKVGRRLTLNEIQFLGLDMEAAEALQARFPGRLERVELALGLDAAEGRLLATLTGLGYPQAAIEGREISADGRRLAVSLAAGDQQRVSSVAVLGVGEAERERLLSQVRIQSGDPLRPDRLAIVALELEEDQRQRGFLDARVRPVVGAGGDGREDNRQPVRFEVDTGSLYKMEGIHFDGLETTRVAWAENLAELPKGQVLRDQDLAAARRRFLESGLFSSILIDTERSPEGGATLRFGVRERPRFSFGYGLRWESEEGGGVVLDFLDRNLGGRGITFGARGLEAGDEQLARLYAVFPRPFGKRFSIETFAQAREEVRRGRVTENFEAALQLSFPIRPGMTSRIYGRYLKRHVPDEVADPFLPVDAPFLGIQFLYDTRLRGQRDGHGLFASADLSGSGELLGSDLRYLRFFGQVSWVRPVARLGSRRLTWAQSYRLGLATTYDERILLEQARFFAGGEFSVRGYPTESLGPSGEVGGTRMPLGGEALLVANQELRMPVWRWFSAVLLFDAGNVWETNRDFASGLATSVGAGLRADTPLGLLRLDLAHPLDPRPGDRDFKLYLGFGQVF